MVAGVVIGIVIWVGTWWGATPALVRALHAEPADEDDYARVFNQVEGLCATMGLALPTVCVVEDEVVDALVLGRRRRVAVLVVTSGLADALDPVQLEGVLAHELVHVKCADIVPATMAAAVALPLVAFLPGMANLVHALAGRGPGVPDRSNGRERHPLSARVCARRWLSWSTVPRPGRRPCWRAGGWRYVTRWLWTASLADADGERRSQGGVAGDLDDVAVRIAALDEW